MGVTLAYVGVALMFAATTLHTLRDSRTVRVAAARR
jgi:hypothetical protein